METDLLPVLLIYHSHCSVWSNDKGDLYNVLTIVGHF